MTDPALPKLSVIHSGEDRRQLLSIARWAASDELGAATEPVQPFERDIEFSGAFVTYYRAKRLRGCVGTFNPTGNLPKTIDHVARLSLKDSRFMAHPITADEIASLTIEISVLSALTPTQDPLSLIPGRHGIMVRQGKSTGCFLPKVATERGWSAQEFLEQCCVHKMGLPESAWMEPASQVSLFEADVFSDARFNDGLSG